MTGSETFSDALKAKRESQNIEISEICEFTKIQPRYIEAMEKGDFTVLPNVYIRLFLRSYAIFIGADSDFVEICCCSKAEMCADPSDAPSTKTEKMGW